jgi:hypothetical protein
VPVSSRICGLDVRTDLELVAGVMCAGYSQGGVLRAGASRREEVRYTVASPPGRYTLRIRHALDPEIWVAAELEVVDR